MNHPIPTIILALALALTACQEKTAEPAATPPNIQPTQSLATQSASSSVTDNGCKQYADCKAQCPEQSTAVREPNKITCTNDKGAIHGERRLFHDDGSRWMVQEWRDNKRDGKTRVWSPTGHKRMEQWHKNGQETGDFMEWHENGQMASQCKNIEEQSIQCEEWYPNGQRTRLTTKKDGKKHGIETGWLENGVKWREQNYANGIAEGLSRTWHPNGTQKSEASYKQGKLTGLLSLYHPNGQKKSEAQYKEGQQLNQTCWDAKGQTIDSPKE